jgi:hypothetical protein
MWEYTWQVVDTIPKQGFETVIVGSWQKMSYHQFIPKLILSSWMWAGDLNRVRSMRNAHTSHRSLGQLNQERNNLCEAYCLYVISMGLCKLTPFAQPQCHRTLHYIWGSTDVLWHETLQTQLFSPVPQPQVLIYDKTTIIRINLWQLWFG